MRASDIRPIDNQRPQQAFRPHVGHNEPGLARPARSACRSSAWLWTLGALLAFPAHAGSPAGCAPLSESEFPIRYDVSFEGDIRPLLQNQCSSCHINGISGGLNFNLANAVSNLLGADERGAPSTGNLAIARVRPFEPLASALFLKLNCEVPPFGGQMPPGGGANPDLQAAIYDWISTGALMPDSAGGHRLFIGRFESIQRP